MIFRSAENRLAETFSDNILKTLQKGFTSEGGDLDVLDICYYMEGNQLLKLFVLDPLIL